MDEQLHRLGASRLTDLTIGDDNSNLEQSFYKWNSKVVKQLEQRFPLDKTFTEVSFKKKIKINQNPSATECCSTSTAKDEGIDCQCNTTSKNVEDDEEEEEDASTMLLLI